MLHSPCELHFLFICKEDEDDINSSVQLFSHVWLFATPWTAACQAFLSITKSQSLLKLMSIELVMLLNHFILYHPLLLLPSIFPSIRVFSKGWVLHIRWPKYWSFSFSISPSKEHPGLISFRIDWIFLKSKGLSRVFSNTAVQKHQLVYRPYSNFLVIFFCCCCCIYMGSSSPTKGQTHSPCSGILEP